LKKKPTPSSSKWNKSSNKKKKNTNTKFLNRKNLSKKWTKNFANPNKRKKLSKKSS